MWRYEIREEADGLWGREKQRRGDGDSEKRLGKTIRKEKNK